MIADLEINKPAPIPAGQKLNPFKSGAEVGPVIKALEQGKPILIKDLYSDGLSLLQELHKYLKLKVPNQSFQEQRKYRAEYHRLSNLVLLEVVDQKLSVKKAPSIGWLEKFYPDNKHFFLTFPQVQGLNSAWQ